MQKRFLLLTCLVVLTAGAAFAQLAANPWKNKSGAADKAATARQYPNGNNTEFGAQNPWGVQNPEYIGDKTTWDKSRGQAEIAPEANITNLLLMTQHLRNMGYQIPDGIDNVISTAPAKLRAEIWASMQQLQSSSNPVATASVTFAQIFENRTGLSIQNLIGNSLRIMDERR